MDTMQALQAALDGRYAIERELGRGGMGVVYLAWETALERVVALKILPPAVATERRRARFLHEARIAARLEHDDIVPIFTVDQAGPFAYYTMAYVPGRTLAQRLLEEGQVAVGEATRILRDVARAVHYAHEQGVVHRDVKPQNILLERTPEGERAYVTDFGIARVMPEGPPPNHAGGSADATFGSHAYASPEQLAGRTTDRRSDVYSLGVVGYVMASGRPLFTGSRDQVVEAHVRLPAPALDVFNQDHDVTLRRAVRRCLAKDPADRFQSADELARTLDLAPELATDLAPRPREFVKALRLQAKAASLAAVAGALAANVAWVSLNAGAWGRGAGALGFLGLLLLSPALGGLLAARRFLKHGYGRADMVQALKRDIRRQREELAARHGANADRKAKDLRFIVALAAGAFFLPAVAALLGADLPERVVILGMTGGAVTFVVGGLALVVAERMRNLVWGRRWLRFWDSRLGGWMAQLAGLGLGPLPPEPPLPQPEPAPAALPSADAPGGPTELDDARRQTASCIRRGRAYLDTTTATRTREGRERTPAELEREETLERQLVALEALLAKLEAADARDVERGSLTDDLEAAREVRYMVDALIEVGEGNGEWGMGNGRRS